MTAFNESIPEKISASPELFALFFLVLAIWTLKKSQFWKTEREGVTAVGTPLMIQGFCYLFQFILFVVLLLALSRPLEEGVAWTCWFWLNTWSIIGGLLVKPAEGKDIVFLALSGIGYGAMLFPVLAFFTLLFQTLFAIV